ncbi:hypothetical protein BJF92_00635 [Rhizobium rhizosphaerae]|uniref:Uncharacterized protein n=1 Tax=Xaviernesmea rhizosphaerae TaxID=1672749 RepID=A0A1Q9AEC6_9HYPH|nr:hypothetical protein [Xaviernesmea rhizosphaerae]OLP53308.1 hypothetical protein BJF92_00635 [Xaviernesmea rhizosphaerae]
MSKKMAFSNFHVADYDDLAIISCCVEIDGDQFKASELYCPNRDILETGPESLLTTLGLYRPDGTGWPFLLLTKDLEEELEATAIEEAIIAQMRSFLDSRSLNEAA